MTRYQLLTQPIIGQAVPVFNEIIVKFCVKDPFPVFLAVKSGKFAADVIK